MPRLEGDIRGCPIPQHRKKNWQIPKYRVENRRNTDTAFMIGHAVSITRVFLFVCLFATVVTSTPAIFFNFQVKRDGLESNRATNLRLKHRLKERYSPLLPLTKWQNIARWGNAIFLQNRKNNTPPSKYLPTLDMRGQMNGTAILWRTASFTRYRYPEGWKTAYRAQGWMILQYRTLKSKLPRYR